MSIKEKMQAKLVASMRKTKNPKQVVETEKKKVDVKAPVAAAKPKPAKNKVPAVKKATAKVAKTYISSTDRVWPD